MSKAFTKEDESGGEDLAGARAHGPELPPGSRNYMTPEGAAWLRAELDALVAAPAPKDPAARRESASRAAYLQRRLDALEIVNPASQTGPEARFGATVTVRDEDGRETAYRIVGVDEADPKSGKISWISPVAAALLGAKAGDAVTLRTPRGEEQLEIIKVEYR